MTVYTNKTGKMRLYDGTSGTPFYLELDFDAGDVSGAIGPKRPEEKPLMDRGNLTTTSVYILGPEDAYLEPIQVTFSALMGDHVPFGYLRTWIRIMNGATASINSNTIVSTKGSTTRNSVTTPAFADASKRTCDIEYLFDGVDDGIKWAEVYIGEDQAVISESAEGSTLAITAMCYGAVSEITAFTSGTSVEA